MSLAAHYHCMLINFYNWREWKRAMSALAVTKKCFPEGRSTQMWKMLWGQLDHSCPLSHLGCWLQFQGFLQQFHSLLILTLVWQELWKKNADLFNSVGQICCFFTICQVETLIQNKTIDPCGKQLTFPALKRAFTFSVSRNSTSRLVWSASSNCSSFSWAVARLFRHFTRWSFTSSSSPAWQQSLPISGGGGGQRDTLTPLWNIVMRSLGDHCLQGCRWHIHTQQRLAREGGDVGGGRVQNILAFDVTTSVCLLQLKIHSKSIIF